MKSQRRLNSQRPISFKRSHPQRKEMKKRLTKSMPRSIIRSTYITKSITIRKKRAMMKEKFKLKSKRNQLPRLQLRLPSIRRQSTLSFKIKMILTVMIFLENKSPKIKKS
jgi:hypothetical protein